MIDTPENISKLLGLNVDLAYLLRSPDGNTPNRIFQEIGRKLCEMKYSLVHQDDMREESPEPTEMKLNLQPMESNDEQ